MSTVQNPGGCSSGGFGAAPMVEWVAHCAPKLGTADVQSARWTRGLGQMSWEGLPYEMCSHLGSRGWWHWPAQWQGNSSAERAGPPHVVRWPSAFAREREVNRGRAIVYDGGTPGGWPSEEKKKKKAKKDSSPESDGSKKKKKKPHKGSESSSSSGHRAPKRKQVVINFHWVPGSVVRNTELYRCSDKKCRSVLMVSGRWCPGLVCQGHIHA